MTANRIASIFLQAAMAAGAFSAIGAHAQNTNVTGNVVVSSSGSKKSEKPEAVNVVVWLKPVPGSIGRDYDTRMAQARSRFKIVQQRKRFEPRILAVPVGSVVDFPNLDPFLHNVFSLFDGKRFDLGLYEQGSTHSVTFDRPGISYIFCNIHPEMSAAVVVVDTPYYAVAKPTGEISIKDVLPGRYQISLWCERCSPDASSEFPRTIEVSGATTSIGTIRLSAAASLLQPHKNKYGLEYDPASGGSGLYGGR